MVPAENRLASGQKQAVSSETRRCAEHPIAKSYGVQSPEPMGFPADEDSVRELAAMLQVARAPQGETSTARRTMKKVAKREAVPGRAEISAVHGRGSEDVRVGSLH